MTEAFRVTESQSAAWPTRATGDPEQAEILDALIERTKPAPKAAGWHKLIAAPFRYPLPVAQTYSARFRPPFFHRNVLYCSGAIATAAYEAAFHFMKQRRHLKAHIATEERLLFSLSITAGAILDIRRRADIRRIMDREDYSASHAFISGQKNASVVLYPSCRDPKRGPNYAVFSIEALGKKISGEQALTLFYDQRKDSVHMRELALGVAWREVS